MCQLQCGLIALAVPAVAQTLPVGLAAPLSVALNQDCYPTCKSTTAAAVGDFTGDGILDVVSISNNGAELNVSAGIGDGSFQPPNTTALNTNGASSFAIAVGDFNGDGAQDFALWGVTGSGAVVQVYLGNGSGGFAYSGTYAAPGSGTSVPTAASLAVADVNGDGKLDIVGVTPYSGVYVFHGNGDGTFGTAMNYNDAQTGAPGAAVAVGDIDGDGKPDLAVSVNNGISVLLNKGGGTFGAATYHEAASGNAQAGAGIVITDLNNDGNADVIAANNAGAFAFLNKGHGAFSVSNTGANAQGGEILAVGDINGDGKKDLVVANGLGEVFTYLGNGKGGFTAGPGYPLTMNSDGSRNVILADFNRDGAPDLLYVQSDDWATVAPGRGDGSFQAGGFTQWGEQNAGHNIVTADFNGDGVADVAYSFVNTTNNTEDFVLRIGTGHGVLGAPAYVKAGPCASNLTEWVAAGDVTGDHKADVVATLTGTSGAGCVTNKVAVLAGKGTGKFGKPAYYATGASAQEGKVYLADLKGDGKPAIVTENADGTISVLLNQGKGTYAPGTLITSIAALYPHDLDLAIGDFTGDGKADIAATTYGNQNVVYVLPGNGDGTFGAPIQTGIGYAPYTLAAGDLDGDGKTDLFVTDTDACGYPSYWGYGVLKGLGNGTFSAGAVTCISSSGYSRDPVLGDFNGDGKPDAFIPYYGNENNAVPYGPTLLQGNGDGSFNATQAPLYVGAFSAGAAAADFDGDGLTDIAVLNNNNLGQGNGDYATFITVLPSIAQAVGLSPLALNYGKVKVGGTKAATVVVTNNQSVSLTISGITVGGANAGDFSQVNTCGSSLKAGWTCTATVTFKPTAAGSRNATLLVNDAVGTQTVVLTGVGK
jgi:hypothetical protein